MTMYLSMLGWKVANIPLVKEVQPPEELFEVDRRRVIGLTIDPAHLRMHRRVRGKRIGIGTGGTYTNVAEIRDEVNVGRRVFRKGGFAIVDTTNKPIEESADEVVELVRKQLLVDEHA